MVDTQTINLTDFFEDKDFNKTYQLTSDGTTPVDITSYSFIWVARLPEATTNAVSKAMSIVAAASGTVSVNLDSSNTDLTQGRTYVYQVQGTTDTSECHVYVEGEFEVKKTY